MTITRRYRFSASHRLHSAALNEHENRAVYGKCNNPLGHGHNYVLEVSVRGPVDEQTGRVIDPARVDELVQDVLLADWEHCNFNAASPEFAGQPPTSENLLRFAWRRLEQAMRRDFPAGPRLARLRLQETRRNVFEIMEEDRE